MFKRAKTALRATALAAGALGAMGLPAVAQTEIRAIGYTSNLYLWGMEEAFYTGPFAEAAGDLVRIEAIPHDLAGLRGPELLALLQDGTLQIASQNISYMAGDDPRFEALDLSGVTLTNADARLATDAYRGVLADVLSERFNVHLLGLAPLPSQVFWCRDVISGLDDLAGKKIRVFNATTSDFVNAVGGTTVTMPFVEVIPALQRGVADCAVTGTSSGNTARWFEVTQSVFPLNVGWSMVFWAANKDAWDGFSPEVQAFLTEQYGILEAEAWEAQIVQDLDALSCSAGGECNLGVSASMTVVPVSDADAARAAEIVQAAVLPNWASRCGADCVAEWNGTVGAAIGIEAALP
ncbi:TRAP transporter substrate-binding protein [Ketogulonicigenium vulgare]|uniref:Putative transport protein n=1 Tax=Ketogulonicigenium vulgare (strain WSH-001) TaxID=759362 RepID=F9Y8W9_KETVW|nr:TRAP transporter substrate-binding protein [Ketogulonicigenium vulgare]ADO41794.1 putative transport protein [Ketogulonicigenium vulgare Y25]AEM40025.1 putative transport protein [Ketogulonicigenium vulgare WSH-001]ALJ80230.1 transporter [Ketogulonicigenium vulgare]ANW33089.1 transporter [Ketogulonicigenium vulgare]AOZ53724.1 transport protein [Ketogulonicigenium vulgare]